MAHEASAPAAHPASGLDTEFQRGLGLYDSTMLVVGAMIGSGIFIVSANMARGIGSAGWLLAAWVITGVLTVAGALSYGELAAMMPRAGGQYVYLREAYSPLWGFLYGWTLFTVIQTGTQAAVAIAFARYFGVLVPWISEQRYLVPPVHLSRGYAVSLSTTQFVGILSIALLTWTNSRGLRYGKIIQNLFTTAKTAGVVALIAIGLFLGWNADAVAANLGHFWTARGVEPVAPGVVATSAFGLFIALAVAQTGSLFSSDAWNNVTFTAGEVKDPRRNIPLSLALGTSAVIALYLLVNVAYLVTLPLDAIQRAPADRVATAMLERVLPGLSVVAMAVTIMISTFGCNNGLILAGARAYYAMAKDGLFFGAAGRLNDARVPAVGLALQGVWATLLVLPRTYDPATGTYGNVYSNLLDYVISANLVFYVLTILAVFRLRATRPDAERPYRAFGYPLVPALYVIGAATILVVLVVYRPATTWPGFVIMFLGLPVYFFWKGRRTEGPGRG
ncbi:MAG TPA: amino acid permease [Vicinamibacterales bacterium]|nr:amino acid permease [Vicinamibacterales bacterium]HOG29987.1 amino acid permease [Vicinamibacterales bacterium]HPW21965.1 amino acid permease [Vicinamibacterales bacterium]